MTEEEQRMEMERRRRIRREKRRRKLIWKRRILIAGMIVVLLLIIFVIFSIRSCRRKAVETQAKIEKQKAQEKEEEKIREKEEHTLRMIAVGDHFYHDTVIVDGQQEDGKWNYDYIYENVKDEIEGADLAVVNQETPIVSDHENTSGYPTFGMPQEGGQAIADLGFNVITMATNHSYDKGKEGITESIEFWNSQKSSPVLLGIHESEQDQQENRVKIVEKKAFKIAMMNYTTLINIGTPVPDNESYLIDIYDEDTVKADVEKAKEKADVVVVFLHSGVEYKNEPDDATKEKMKYLAQLGVDVVIGTHPHVIRPYGIMERPDGKNMLIYYSLGNFVSGQQGMSQLLEGMADITFFKDPETGEITIEQYSMEPMVMHYESGFQSYAVYPLEKYTKELAAVNGVHQESEDSFTLESIREYFAPYMEPRTFEASEN